MQTAFYDDIEPPTTSARAVRLFGATRGKTTDSNPRACRSDVRCPRKKTHVPCDSYCARACVTGENAVLHCERVRGIARAATPHRSVFERTLSLSLRLAFVAAAPEHAPRRRYARVASSQHHSLSISLCPRAFLLGNAQQRIRGRTKNRGSKAGLLTRPGAGCRGGSFRKTAPKQKKKTRETSPIKSVRSAVKGRCERPRDVTRAVPSVRYYTVCLVVNRTTAIFPGRTRTAQYPRRLSAVREWE